ncbi:MAG: hypothetical protein AAB459_03130 [Patescibacteria group bacterium]
MNPFGLIVEHPLAISVAGGSMIAGSILSYELFPDSAHLPGETMVEDTMYCLGIPLVIIGGGISAVRSKHTVSRVIGATVTVVACIMAALTATAYIERPER